jgi:hypothetical protein
MNVKELMEALSGMDPEATVHFAYNYGDHWRTTVAPEVGDVREGYVAHSSCHDMPKEVRANEDDFEPEKAREVVLLKS